MIDWGGKLLSTSKSEFYIKP